MAELAKVHLYSPAGPAISIGVVLIFEVRDAEEGGYHARALGHGIFTQAETWDELIPA